MDNFYGVLTGDLVKSSHMTPEQLQQIHNTLKTFEKEYGKTYMFSLDIFRGDAFQIICSLPEFMLQIAIHIRMLIMLCTPSVARYTFDARMSIAFGTVNERYPDMEIR